MFAYGIRLLIVLAFAAALITCCIDRGVHEFYDVLLIVVASAAALINCCIDRGVHQFYNVLFSIHDSETSEACKEYHSSMSALAMADRSTLSACNEHKAMA